jgi:ABC-type sugar transport system ATPase subunit
MSGVPLLALEHVSRWHVDGRRARVALDDVSLQLAAGEIVTVWGARGSGRTTLLRVAAGLERPDAGRVLFDGRDVAGGGETLLGDRIGWAQSRIVGPERQSLVERLAIPLVARGHDRAEALERVRAALHRSGVDDDCELRVGDLDPEESVRVGIAQMLLLEPRLLIVDEPVAAVQLTARNGVLALLRSVADAGTAVLMTAGEALGLSGVDRALTISGGRLRADVVSAPAQVLRLDRRRAADGPR